MSRDYMMLTSNNWYNNSPVAAQTNAGLDLLDFIGGIKFTSELKVILETEAAVQVAHNMSYVGLYYSHT